METRHNIILLDICRRTEEKTNLKSKQQSKQTLCIEYVNGLMFKFKFKFNEISSEAGQMASIPGYTIVSRNTFQYTMI